MLSNLLKLRAVPLPCGFVMPPAFKLDGGFRIANRVALAENKLLRRDHAPEHFAELKKH